jgi:chromosome segregation ATPase
MSSRKSKVPKREETILVKLVKELTKKMDSFEESVTELKLLKDSVMELNEQIADQERNNEETLKELRQNLKENKLKTLNEEVLNMGRIMISSEDLDELKNEVQKWKDECAKIKLSVQKEIKEAVQEQTERKLQIQSLEFENKTAKLNASCDSYKSEIQNLKDTISRMSQELESQKKLTAQVVSGGRNIETKNN